MRLTQDPDTKERILMLLAVTVMTALIFFANALFGEAIK